MIFYQGESDCMESKDYCDALKAMVEDYRVRFGSDLLFLNVQLTSYGYESGGVNLDGVWNYVPDMRFAEAEVKIDGSIRGYEVIPSIDVGWKEGDADGAHPYYKLELGQRGAQMAAAILYGIGNMEDAGFPIPARVLHNNDEIIVLYDYAGGGLKTLNGADVQGFEVKLNGAWQPAQAVIDGNKITVAASGAEGIRYASSLRYTSTDTANLCSGTGNIAVPFSVEFN
jgi:sialate O-acetylesterase